MKTYPTYGAAVKSPSFATSEEVDSRCLIRIEHVALEDVQIAESNLIIRKGEIKECYWDVC